MNEHVKTAIGHSACPHDCPSTCALEVDLIGSNRIGRLRGAAGNTYTDGVICAKVARYAERLHHPDRLTHPLRRKGPKGSKQFERISWDDALDITAEAMLAAERKHGPEAVWPYYYAGTMGLVMRDGINRLRHAKRYSNMFASICTTLAWPATRSPWIARRSVGVFIEVRRWPKKRCLVLSKAERAADLACRFSVPSRPVMLAASIAASRLLWITAKAPA